MFTPIHGHSPKQPKGYSFEKVFSWPVSRHTYHFIPDETMGTKRLIEKLFQMIKRFRPGSFRCNQPVIIVSIIMKRYLDKPEIPLYYNDIFISQL